MDRLSGLCGNYILKFPKFNEENNAEVWDVTDAFKAEVVNILWEWHLSDVLIQLTKHGHAWEFSDNLINDFEIEREIKVLDVNIEEVVKKLLWLWAIKVFDGWVHDVYIDYADKELENKDAKVSFRFRFKISEKGKLSIFYTIKKKINDEIAQDIRSVYESELKLSNPMLVSDLLGAIWLQETREKIQKRQSLSHGETKFDFNKSHHEAIKDWLEIETSHWERAKWMVDLLGLWGHEIKNVGSRKFYKNYGVEYGNLDKESKLEIPEPIDKYIKKIPK